MINVMYTSDVNRVVRAVSGKTDFKNPARA